MPIWTHLWHTFRAQRVLDGRPDIREVGCYPYHSGEAVAEAMILSLINPTYVGPVHHWTPRAGIGPEEKKKAKERSHQRASVTPGGD